MKLTRRDVVTWLPAAMALAKCTRRDETAPLKFLTDAEVAALNGYADEIFPSEGSSLGAVTYVDRLLSDTLVFFSSLGTPVELDRVTRKAWELRVAALEPMVRSALGSGKSLDQLTPDDRELVCSLVTEAAFARPEYGGNPGNAGSKLIGSAGNVMPQGFVSWDGEKNVERAEAPVSTAEPGTDDFPLDQWTRDLLDEVTRATGGTIAP